MSKTEIVVEDPTGEKKVLRETLLRWASTLDLKSLARQVFEEIELRSVFYYKPRDMPLHLIQLNFLDELFPEQNGHSIKS